MCNANLQKREDLRLLSCRAEPESYISLVMLSTRCVFFFVLGGGFTQAWMLIVSVFLVSRLLTSTNHQSRDLGRACNTALH